MRRVCVSYLWPTVGLWLLAGCPNDPERTCDGACVEVDGGPRSDGAPRPGDDAGRPPPVDGETLVRMTVENDRDVARVGEIARSGVALPRDRAITDVARLAVVGDDDVPLPAQMRSLARWGGDPADSSLPIMWLEVQVQLDVPARSSRALRLIALDAPPPVTDPVSYEDDVVDTGAARFELDPTSPALFAEIRRGDTVLSPRGGTGAGPRVVLEDGTVLDADDVTDLRFEVLDRGPLSVTVRQHGRFEGGAATRCDAGAGYQALAYEISATFARGSDDVELRYTVRNECGSNVAPWDDESFVVTEWSFGVALPAPSQLAWIADAALATANGSELRVAQRRGGGAPWVRRAEVLVDGASQVSAPAYEATLAGAVGDGWAAGAELAFMRYREPQAVLVRDATLVVAAIGERLVLGEAVGLWNHARISFATDAASLEQDAALGHATLERGLLLHTDVEDLSAAQVFLPLREAGTSTLDTTYLAVMDQLHRDTVSTGGQWDRARTFGSQLWPDTQYDQYDVDHATPYENNGAMNYWNPLGAELFEHLRTGDPEWAWTMGLPAAWLQAHTAYYNVGEQTHSIRNGVASSSGGTGEGGWHRGSNGSDDYTYNWGIKLAYLVRPEPALLERFRHGGLAMAARYGVADAASREEFVSQRAITRQVMQHLELLFDCAQFVPGDDGDICRTRLHEIVGEMASENLAPGVMCAEETPANPCFTPQQFMQASFMFEVFVRYELTYPGRIPGLREDLVEIGAHYGEYGLARAADGSIDVDGDFGAGMECTLTADRADVVSCVPYPNSDGNLTVYPNNHPQALAMVLMADELDPDRARCATIVSALDDPAIDGQLRGYLTDVGYWKGQSQVLQGLVYAVGAAGTCP